MRPSLVSQLFPEGGVPVLEASLRFAHLRQTAITNNLANLETPHYRRQDVSEPDFQRMLRRAIAERAERHPNRWYLEGEGEFAVRRHRYPDLPGRPGEPFPEPAGEGPVRHDENHVVPEAEVAALQKNTLALRALQQFFAKSVSGPATASKFRIE